MHVRISHYLTYNSIELMNLDTLGGPNLKMAFQQAGVGMMGYMTDLDKVEIDPQVESVTASVQGIKISSSWKYATRSLH